MVRNVLTNNATHRLILVDSPKAFGNIDRGILWAKLYEDGLPFNIAKTIKMAHEGNKLIPKCDGYIGKSGNNNKGIFQGSPLSSTLFAI